LQPDEAALLDAARAARLSMEFLGEATIADFRVDPKT
jgi:hypothetical protein